MKNIGGSLLPSSNPQILKPIGELKQYLWKGLLQVIPDEEQDTYHLMLIGEESSVLASHPNGFSCHCLGERILSGDKFKAMSQAVYIISCGGTLTGVGAAILQNINSR